MAQDRSWVYEAVENFIVGFIAIMIVVLIWALICKIYRSFKSVFGWFWANFRLV